MADPTPDWFDRFLDTTINWLEDAGEDIITDFDEFHDAMERAMGFVDAIETGVNEALMIHLPNVINMAYDPGDIVPFIGDAHASSMAGTLFDFSSPDNVLALLERYSASSDPHETEKSEIVFEQILEMLHNTGFRLLAGRKGVPFKGPRIPATTRSYRQFAEEGPSHKRLPTRVDVKTKRETIPSGFEPDVGIGSQKEVSPPSRAGGGGGFTNRKGTKLTVSEYLKAFQCKKGEPKDECVARAKARAQLLLKQGTLTQG